MVEIKHYWLWRLNMKNINKYWLFFPFHFWLYLWSALTFKLDHGQGARQMPAACLKLCVCKWDSVWHYKLHFSSVIQLCPTLCDPMDRSTPGLPVHHQLPEFTQTHVHWVSDAIQPSHPLSSLSPPAPNPSQHQSLFQWVNSSHEVAKVLEFQL